MLTLTKEPLASTCFVCLGRAHDGERPCDRCGGTGQTPEPTPAEALEFALRNCDWFGENSDDARYWRPAMRQRQRIAALLPLVPEGEARELWSRYAARHASGEQIPFPRKEGGR